MQVLDEPILERNFYGFGLFSVPLISRLCPNDTYKIYKSGSKVRVDTTLVGVDTTNGGIAGTPNWQRGKKSYIFTGSGECCFLIQGLSGSCTRFYRLFQIFFIFTN